MYKATQDACHRQRREGSFSTMPSARGVNLLGWEEPEELSPDEQRKMLARRVGQIQAFLAVHKNDIEGKEKWKLIKEMTKNIDQIRKLKPGKRTVIKDLPDHFMQVARERLTKPEFMVWLAEARQRAHSAATLAQQLNEQSDAGSPGSERPPAR